MPRRTRFATILPALFLLAGAATAQVPAPGVASLSGDGVGCLRGAAEVEIALLACAADCAPIPWQLDERDGDGRWALDQGPEPNLDDPPGIVDDNDELVWMAADGGRRATRDELPVGECVVEVEVRRGEQATWVYAVRTSGAAPRSPRRYVTYDPAADRVEGERVAVGFGAPTPRYLAVRGPGAAFGPNLLDRLKVRAHARFLGFIPLGRDEDDIEYAFSAWRAGPVRVLRREYQWVRLASWLRTPVFETETLMTRDAMTLPVRLRLNFPPTYFFAGIEVQAVLDFRDLRGWQVAADGRPAVRVGDAAAARLDGTRSDWVAMRGADATLTLELVRGPSLATLVPTIVYRDAGEPAPPEGVPGEAPAIGYRLTEWSDVDRGTHWFAAVARALPPDADLAAFARERDQPITVSARQLTTP
ncbi:hypothetical protein KF840_15505 [bacterium]|nr:hypothetical protein [bacterium]